VRRRGRPAISVPGERRDEPRRPLSVVLSAVIHVVVFAAIVRLLMLPGHWSDFLNGQAEPIPVERIGFLALPRGDKATPPRSGGDNRRETEVAPAPREVPLQSPTATPSALPSAPPPPAVRDEGGSGPLVGTGGPARGIRPAYTDPRVWLGPTQVVAAPMSPKARLDSSVAANIQHLNDSIALLPRERAPGDWTITKNGKKYGIDQQFIRLGPFSIPTALLAALPLNVTANPTAVERDRRLSSMRFEIQEQAARAARDDEFRAAVKSLRERKQKEREERKKLDQPVPPDRNP
jgi:hypothetical protein